MRGAAAIRDALAEVGVEVRSGLHTGECELFDDDIGGIAVHIAARVNALAGACEVLVSGTVKDLVVGSEIEFSPRGETPLKGIPGRWSLFAVESAYLTFFFHPLHSTLEKEYPHRSSGGTSKKASIPIRPSTLFPRFLKSPVNCSSRQMPSLSETRSYGM